MAKVEQIETAMGKNYPLGMVLYGVESTRCPGPLRKGIFRRASHLIESQAMSPNDTGVSFAGGGTIGPGSSRNENRTHPPCNSVLVSKSRSVAASGSTRINVQCPLDSHFLISYAPDRASKLLEPYTVAVTW